MTFERAHKRRKREARERAMTEESAALVPSGTITGAGDDLIARLKAIWTGDLKVDLAIIEATEALAALRQRETELVAVLEKALRYIDKGPNGPLHLIAEIYAILVPAPKEPRHDD